MLWSLKTRDLLRQGLERSLIFTGSGISAMPHMHVATTTLFAIPGWRVSCGLDMVLTVFAAIILLDLFIWPAPMPSVAIWHVLEAFGLTKRRIIKPRRKK